MTNINIPKFNADDSEFNSILNLCGNSIGEGTTRIVYEIPNLNMVLKVSKLESNFANWSEIIFFNLMQSETIDNDNNLIKIDSDEIAKIYSWSLSGRFLIMKKLDKICDMRKLDFEDHIKKQSLITDKKKDNYGFDNDDKKIKSIDYALFKIENYFGYI